MQMEAAWALGNLSELAEHQRDIFVAARALFALARLLESTKVPIQVSCEGRTDKLGVFGVSVQWLSGLWPASSPNGVVKDSCRADS